MECLRIFWEEPFFTGMMLLGSFAFWFYAKWDEAKEALKNQTDKPE